MNRILCRIARFKQEGDINLFNIWNSPEAWSRLFQIPTDDLMNKINSMSRWDVQNFLLTNHFYKLPINAAVEKELTLKEWTAKINFPAHEICNYAFKHSKSLIDSIYYFLRRKQQETKLEVFNIDGKNLTFKEISDIIDIPVAELRNILKTQGLKQFINYVNYMTSDELKDELADYNINLDSTRAINRQRITVNFDGEEITHTYEEWAKILDISVDTIRYWINKGKNLPDPQQLIKEKILQILNNIKITSYDKKTITVNFNNKDITHTYNEWIKLLNIYPGTFKKWLLDGKNLSDTQQVVKEKILHYLNNIKGKQQVITVNFNGKDISKTYQEWSEYLSIPLNTLRLWRAQGKNENDKFKYLKENILSVLNGTYRKNKKDRLLKTITVNFNGKDITHTYNEWTGLLNLQPNTIKSWLDKATRQQLSDKQQIAKENILNILNGTYKKNDKSKTSKTITVSFNGKDITHTYNEWMNYLQCPKSTFMYWLRQGKNKDVNDPYIIIKEKIIEKMRQY